MVVFPLLLHLEARFITLVPGSFNSPQIAQPLADPAGICVFRLYPHISRKKIRYSD
jgi:hypothetical protein